MTMKTYRAEYYKSGKIVHFFDFEAKSRKEAIPIAQDHKTHSPEIQKAGRVRTSVGCLSLLLTRVEKLIHEAERLIRMGVK